MLEPYLEQPQSCLQSLCRRCRTELRAQDELLNQPCDSTDHMRDIVLRHDLVLLGLLVKGLGVDERVNSLVQ